MRGLIVVVLVLVLAMLGSAGVAMLRKRPQRPGEPDTRMARALAWRIGLSIALFLFVLLAWHLGWITPTGLSAGR